MNEHTPLSRLSRQHLARLALSGAGLLIVAGCAGGARPVLVEVDTSVATVAAGLPAAPPEAVFVGTPDPDASPEPEVDDALYAWAESVDINYKGNCAGTERSEGELCGRAEGVGSVYLIGPTATEIWYVASIEFSTAGYRVTEVAIAGR